MIVKTPTNTVKANKAAANLLSSYLKEKHMETNFEMFDVATLAENSPILSLQSHNINKHKINVRLFLSKSQWKYGIYDKLKSRL